MIQYKRLFIVMIFFIILFSAGYSNEDTKDSSKSSLSRVPQWPLKISRTLHSDEEIQRARKACLENEDAKKIKEDIMKDADYWVAKSEEELRQLLPGPEVYRAFDVSTRGCPVHGKDVYKFGTYPWILDREKPFVIKCPVGGEEYPSNDYFAYYKTGMKDKSLLTGKYADDSHGWIALDGEKYWFVAYACHWAWRNFWVDAVKHLAQAYILTGERKYAEKCIVMLDRIAEIYPGFDHTHQSRYGELSKTPYHGKILNKIWETRVFYDLVWSYDSVFDALIDKNPVQLKHRNSEQIRANIEANLLEEGIDCIKKGYIAGNWGMHQRALVATVLTRQHAPQDELLSWMFFNTGLGDFIYNIGVNYTLYNLVSADGMPFENSPMYSFGWVANVSNIADALKPSGIDLYKNPKVKQMFDTPLDLLCLGKFTPSIGDAGAIDSEFIGLNADTYKRAYRSLKDPQYAWIISKQEKGGSIKDYLDFEDLFLEPISNEIKETAKNYTQDSRSRLLDDYGLAILNNQEDSIALSMFYGLRAGHGHFDCMNIELFAQGNKPSPDLGYPDFMNTFVPGIASWTKNTISHNTVVVNSHRQDPDNSWGKMTSFHDSEKVHILEVEADKTYRETSIYRRMIVQVNVNDSDSYFVDVFRVSGGDAHDLSIHGAPGDFKMLDMELSAQETTGTLAGKDIPYGFLYDDPVRNKPDYKGGYYEYSGSGYQHLFNAQRGRKGESGIAEWKLKDGSDAFLRVHVLPETNQQIIAADAYVSPTRKRPDVIKYVLAQRRGENLESCYISVWEPFQKTPFIKKVSELPLKMKTIQSDEKLMNKATRAIALSIHLASGTEHIICISPYNGIEYSVDDLIKADSKIAVLEKEGNKTQLVFATGGKTMILNGKETVINPIVKGTVLDVDYTKRMIKVKWDGNRDPGFLLHKWMRIFNDRISSMRQITSVSLNGDILEIEIGKYDLMNALLLTGEINASESAIQIRNPMPWGNQLLGMHILTENLEPAGMVESLGESELKVSDIQKLKEKLTDSNKDKRIEIYLSKIGPGNSFEIE